MLYSPVTLGEVSKRHDKKILVIAFPISVHDRVSLPTPDSASAVQELELLEMNRKVGK